MLFRRNQSFSERIFKGSRYQFLALGRDEIKTFMPDVPYLVVSISDPDKPETEIPDSPNLQGVLRLQFHDVGLPRKFEVTSDLAMTPEHARQILSFIRERLPGVKLIVCQCEEGVSRSTGMAAALSRILEGEDEYFFQGYWPNRWVYELLLAQAEELKAKDGSRA
jgi:hypothetical protein